MSEMVVQARRAMKNSFKIDLDFYHSYVANVAMVIYDRHSDKLSIEECNTLADQILKKIFT